MDRPIRDFRQVEWDSLLEEDLRELLRLAVREDLERGHDWTTLAMAPIDSRGEADFRARQPGVAAGVRALPLVIDELGLDAELLPLIADGAPFGAGETLATLRGSARDLLTGERVMLNLLGRLTGIASWTRRHVEAAGPRLAVYDTRKTTPGWRRLEKYAVRCGGGHNHRTGLYDAVLIKDNHLALARTERPELSLADAVRFAREFVAEQRQGELLVEIEVDSLEQLWQALPGAPDLVLLDNMAPATLREAVAIRDAEAPRVVLEASGGVSLDTLPAIAATGVDRVSIGALTHGAVSLDIGLDWR